MDKKPSEKINPNDLMSLLLQEVLPGIAPGWFQALEAMVLTGTMTYLTRITSGHVQTFALIITVFSHFLLLSMCMIAGSAAHSVIAVLRGRNDNQRIFGINLAKLIGALTTGILLAGTEAIIAEVAANIPAI